MTDPTSTSDASEGPRSFEPSSKESPDLRWHLSALRRFWRSLVACVLVGIAAAVGAVVLVPPTYLSTVTFFVATSAAKGSSPLQADEYAQRRINSYVGVVTSDKLARTVLNDTGLQLTPEALTQEITASADPDTVLMTVSVTDTSSERSLVIARSIAANLDGVIGELDNRSKGDQTELRVISGPTLKPNPVSPRPKLYLAIGLLLGVGVGVAQALVRQQLDTTFRSREQLARLTGLPTLGQVFYESRARRLPVITAQDSRSHRAEAFRQLRTSLRFANAAGTVEMVLVTSSIEGEGKTSTSINLAQSFADAGRRVLLVDADLRKPKLETYLDLEAGAGLTTVLIGEAELSQVVQEWGAGGMDVLASGPIPPNPSELLGSPVMERFVKQARADYDTVIIDTPPLLPVTDAAVLSVLADGVILVVRHGKARRDQVSQSRDMLSSIDARVLGTVLTMVPASRTDRLPTYYHASTSPGRSG